MKGVLPAPILARKKMGFPVPVGAWFRGEFGHLLDEFVLGPRSRARGIFEPETTRRLVSAHRSGEPGHDEQLWALLNFEIWQRVFLDREPPEAVRLQTRSIGKRS
jgi:asparagine synthase (glutamine-hydrolysing)